ncbi:hypothetical protein D3C84_879870 [compost metagenome]
MARATPSITASGSTPDCWRRRENSLKPARKICSTPQSGSGLLPAWRYSLDRSIPDQKRSSNTSSDFLAARSMVLRWKIMIHDVTEAATRTSMTSCTTKLALLIRLHMDIWSTAALASTLTLLQGIDPRHRRRPHAALREWHGVSNCRRAHRPPRTALHRAAPCPLPA